MKAYGTWLASHGLMRLAFRDASRRGELVAQLTLDHSLREDPYPAYETLRRRGRIYRTRQVAATVSHPVANHILRSEDFGTAAGRGGLPGPARQLMARLADPHAVGPVDPPSLLAVDGEQHTRYRRLVSKAFTARSVAGLGDRVEAVADRLLDELAPETGFDLVDRYAAQLPVAIIADLLGVPEAERAQVLAWGNEAAVMLDPGLTWRQWKRAHDTIREMHRWFQAHVDRLRVDPGGDLLSRLAVMTGPDRMDDDELRGVGLLVLGAGFETTVSLLSNAVKLLDDHPDQRAAALASPDLWTNVVEESLRFDSPVQATIREAYCDTEVLGERVRKGEAVLLMIGGANRDPDVFADPARFDVTRGNAHEHLSFSAGPHFCLGASLARLEGTVGLRMLYERYPDLRVSGRAERRPTQVLHGWERLPVTVGTPVPQSAPAPSAGR
ncbi:MAG TPA: cytochrome P450 [Nocardioidaceae bacterium]|nr:cytochrome P450 [Nocardioidaceae bacterium]